MRLYVFGILTLLVLIQTVHATHSIEYKKPDSIVATVGQLSTFQIDIKNSGSTQEYYKVAVSAAPSIAVEITNPSITTPTINPGQSISISTNLRPLTETPVVLTVNVYRDNDLSHAVSFSVPMASKKLSLPEFGLIGFIQIVLLSSVVFFLVNRNFTAKQESKFSGH